MSFSDDGFDLYPRTQRFATGGIVRPGGALMGGMFACVTRAARTEADLEVATTRLLAVTGSQDFAAALVEVDRRQELFAEIRKGSPRGGQHPRLAALESVTHDVILGRLS